VGPTLGSFVDSETATGNTFGAWTSTLWTQTTQADFNAGVLNNVDISSSSGDVKLARAPAYLYALRGLSTTDFWRYDIANNSWTAMTATPSPVQSGGALIYDGIYIYALRGLSTTDFWRYDIANNSWTAMTATPSPVQSGGALIYDGTYIYALRGNSSTDFWRYDIANNSWTARASTLAIVGAGGALTYDETYIYALRGNNSTDFWRYDIANNSWAARASTLATVTDSGGRLTYDGSYIYALRGNSSTDFWRYDIANNSWTARASTPAQVAGGGALSYDSSYIYALRGNSSRTFWRYSITGNTWTATGDRTNTPDTVGSGGSLVRGAVFVTAGTLASQVLDTGVAATRWDALFWDKTLPASTGITFEVRASASSFLKGDASPSWTSVGGTSPILSGLPSGRYVQWRATLTTSNSANTPTLSEVRVYYH